MRDSERKISLVRDLYIRNRDCAWVCSSQNVVFCDRAWEEIIPMWLVVNVTEKLLTRSSLVGTCMYIEYRVLRWDNGGGEPSNAVDANGNNDDDVDVDDEAYNGHWPWWCLLLNGVGRKHWWWWWLELHYC